jgi:hypothetical protein
MRPFVTRKLTQEQIDNGNSLGIGTSKVYFHTNKGFDIFTAGGNMELFRAANFPNGLASLFKGEQFISVSNVSVVSVDGSMGGILGSRTYEGADIFMLIESNSLRYGVGSGNGVQVNTMFSNIIQTIPDPDVPGEFLNETGIFSGFSTADTATVFFQNEPLRSEDIPTIESSITSSSTFQIGRVQGADLNALGEIPEDGIFLGSLYGGKLSEIVVFATDQFDLLRDFVENQEFAYI